MLARQPSLWLWPSTSQNGRPSERVRTVISVGDAVPTWTAGRSADRTSGPGAAAAPEASEERTMRSRSSPVAAAAGARARWLPRARAIGPSHGSIPRPRRASAASPSSRYRTAWPSMRTVPTHPVASVGSAGAGASPGIAMSAIDTGGNAAGGGGTDEGARRVLHDEGELVRGRGGEGDRHGHGRRCPAPCDALRDGERHRRNVDTVGPNGDRGRERVVGIGADAEADAIGGDRLVTASPGPTAGSAGRSRWSTRRPARP